RCDMYKFFFSSRRRHTRSKRDWSSDVCSSDLVGVVELEVAHLPEEGLPPGDREVSRGVVHEHAAHWFGRPVPRGARWDHLSAGEQLQHAAGAVEHSVRGGPGDGQRAVDVELIADRKSTRLNSSHV